MSLYSLTGFQKFQDPVLDTHALLGWSSDTAVLAFRGTASLTNACSDLRVMPCQAVCLLLYSCPTFIVLGLAGPGKNHVFGLWPGSGCEVCAHNSLPCSCTRSRCCGLHVPRAKDAAWVSSPEASHLAWFMQVWMTPHPPKRGIPFWTCPKVHSGFYRAWTANSLHTEVMDFLQVVLGVTCILAAP